jgi:hypothetical protein
MKLQIFLAHGSEDKPRVRKIYEALKKHGFKPWLDEIDIPPGADWPTEIEKAIQTSHFFCRLYFQEMCGATRVFP